MDFKPQQILIPFSKNHVIFFAYDNRPIGKVKGFELHQHFITRSVSCGDNADKDKASLNNNGEHFAMNHQNKGSTWRIWDLHLHSPCSILNNGFGDPQKSETWKEYINNIECKCREKNIAAVAITDYFTIEGYKRVKKYSDEGRLEGILVLPNIEFRLDKIITVNGLNPKRLNFHVILSPEIDPKDIEDRFLHELDFIYKEDTF